VSFLESKPMTKFLNEINARIFRKFFVKYNVGDYVFVHRPHYKNYKHNSKFGKITRITKHGEMFIELTNTNGCMVSDYKEFVTKSSPKEIMMFWLEN
jgi:hypothetical protein